MKPPFRNLKILIISGIALIGIFATGLYVAGILFDESLYCKRGSLEYFIAIHSPNIRDFPIIDPAGEVLFHSSCGDGNKLPSQGIHYISRATESQIMGALKIWFHERGFIAPRDCERIYMNKDYRFDVSFSSNEHGIVVTADETKN